MQGTLAAPALYNALIQFSDEKTRFTVRNSVKI